MLWGGAVRACGCVCVRACGQGRVEEGREELLAVGRGVVDQHNERMAVGAAWFRGVSSVGRWPSLVLLLVGFAAVTSARTPPPPGCSISRGYACEDTLQACQRTNNSVHENFCQCYEQFVSCLVAIDPKSCMRGGYCLINNHRCEHFNCAFDKSRCRPCYARTEYDMDPDHEESLIEAFANNIGISLPTTFILIVGTYVTIGCWRRVKTEGKEWGWDACPHRNFWKLFCCCIMPAPKKKRKKKKKKPKKSKKDRVPEVTIEMGRGPGSGAESDEIEIELDPDDLSDEFVDDDGDEREDDEREDDGMIEGEESQLIH